MSALAWQRVKHSAARVRRESYLAAMSLDTVGMPVVVILENGQTMHTETAGIPSTTKAGFWIVDVRGVGEMGCECVTPAGKAVAA